jgi:hypothetical protein
MRIKTAWAVQSFLLCFVFNLVFSAVIFFMAGRVLDAFTEWVSSLNGAGLTALPEDVHTAFGSLGNLVAQVRGYLLAVMATLGLSFTFLLWFFLFLTGRRQIRRALEYARSIKPSDRETVNLDSLSAEELNQGG